jgi:hypothetical protein
MAIDAHALLHGKPWVLNSDTPPRGTRCVLCDESMRLGYKYLLVETPQTDAVTWICCSCKVYLPKTSQVIDMKGAVHG